MARNDIFKPASDAQRVPWIKDVFDFHDGLRGIVARVCRVQRRHAIKLPPFHSRLQGSLQDLCE
jgi:hypothetical protein